MRTQPMKTIYAWNFYLNDLANDANYDYTSFDLLKFQAKQNPKAIYSNLNLWFFPITLYFKSVLSDQANLRIDVLLIA